MTTRLNLVTGACGFCGSHLVKHLLARGERVLATDLERAFGDARNRSVFERIGLDFTHPNCTAVPSDLLDRASLARLFERGVTRVFHTASLYDYSAPLEVLRRVNVEGGRNLFELACGAPALERFVHWSTCGVFGKPHAAAEGPACNQPFTERSSSPRNTPLGQPQPDGTRLANDYSVSKWEQEQLAWKFHRERGLPLTVLRPAPMYGPGSDYGHGGIVLAIHKGFLPAVPLDARNYLTTSVHIEDVARFAAFIAGEPAGLGEDFNVVDDAVVSYYEFLRYIALLLGRRMIDLPVVSLRGAQPVLALAARAWLALERRWGVKRLRVFEVGSAAYVASSYWFDNAKSKSAGFTYRYPDVREGLRETIAWFRDAGWLAPGYQPRAAQPAV